jgi:hypothetical protein
MSVEGAGSQTTEMIRWAVAGFGAFVLALFAGVGLLQGAEHLIESDWARSGHVVAWVALVWWAVLGIAALGGQYVFDFAAPETRWYVAAKGLFAGVAGLLLATSAFAGFLTEWAGDRVEYERAALIHFVEGGAPGFLWFAVLAFHNAHGAPRLATLFGRWGIVATVLNLAVWLTGWRAGSELPPEFGAYMAFTGAIAGWTASGDEDSRSDDTPEHLRETARRMPRMGWMAHVAAPMLTLGPVVTSLSR